MQVQEFDYHLREECIAQQPCMPRDVCKLMVVHNGVHHRVFYEIVDYLHKNDVLVLNDTKVRHARLHAHKLTGGKLELLVLGTNEESYRCLVKGKVRPGTAFTLDADTGIRGTILNKINGLCEVDMSVSLEELERLGNMPLPPYIKADIDLITAELYQTTYAQKLGSVAAPTAGLHFSSDLLAAIERLGVKVISITLHVGIGTFMPIRSKDIEKHMMQPEYYHISNTAAQAINTAIHGNHQIIAVGTTTVKTLESAACDGFIEPGSGWSNLFIYPGYTFRSPITGMLTNFHLPQSTPLLLTCAFAGKTTILDAYKKALRSGYRFLSFGDAMLILDRAHV